jgi:hypothetical protein
VREIIRERVAEHPLPSVVTFAKATGCTAEHVQAVLDGKRGPSWKLLRAVGLTRRAPPAHYWRVR